MQTRRTPPRSRRRADGRKEDLADGLRDMIGRFGVTAVTLAVTFAVVLTSATLLLALNLMTRGGVSVIDLLIATVVPAALVGLFMPSIAGLLQKVERAEERLSKLAIEDYLTRTYNRNHILTLGEREWDRSGRQGYPMALLLVDLDNFRQLNERHGNDVGDAVLRTLVQVSRTCLRTSDVIGRFGGEEFLILLTEADEPGAVRVAERLRTTFERTPIDAAGTALGATVSIGVAAREPATPSLAALIAQTEAALLSAKAHGRNRVTRASVLGEEDLAVAPTLLRTELS